MQNGDRAAVVETQQVAILIPSCHRWFRKDGPDSIQDPISAEQPSPEEKTFEFERFLFCRSLSVCQDAGINSLPFSLSHHNHHPPSLPRPSLFSQKSPQSIKGNFRLIPWLIVREREKKNLLDPFEISSRGDRSLDWLARSIEVKGEENLDIQGGGRGWTSMRSVDARRGGKKRGRRVSLLFRKRGTRFSWPYSR